MTTRRALITGVTGQDGSYLAEYLLNLGYEVHGSIRTTTSDVTASRIGHLVAGDEPAITLHVADLGDAGSLLRLVETVQPTEVYNLAAQSHVRASFDQPVQTGDITALGATRLLEAILHTDRSIRFYQASSSEMFGGAPPPQNEQTRFHPRSPYGIAKVYAHWATVNYREAHGLFAVSGICFNHESPRRGPEFVTRKIARGVARIMSGEAKRLRLGNLDARRDWGHARDYVEAMHAMLQLDEPTDLVIGTGENHTVREFLELAFDVAGLDLDPHVEIDPTLFRPADIDDLRSDPSRAREVLGWGPRTSFRELVREMVAAELEARGMSLPG